MNYTVPYSVYKHKFGEFQYSFGEVIFGIDMCIIYHIIHYIISIYVCIKKLAFTSTYPFLNV